MNEVAEDYREGYTA